MSVTHAFDLVFHAPVRLGGGARDDADAARDVPSDTLSAALVVAAADLFGDNVAGRSLAEIARDPPWVISSLLPWVEIKGVVVRFYPRPLGRSVGNTGGDKAFRRVAYVSEVLLTSPNGPVTMLSKCGSLAHTTDAIRDVVWQRRAVRASVTLDRVTSEPHLFHLEEVALATVPPGAHAGKGAWVAVRAENDADMKLVHTLLDYLASSGLGADRARGLGRFSVVRQTKMALDEGKRERMLIGYASPDAELTHKLGASEARYSIVRRGGAAHGAHGGLGLPRKVIRLLGPGSVIPDVGPVVGCTRDVTPEAFSEHPIYRDGRTIAWVLPQERRT